MIHCDTNGDSTWTPSEEYVDSNEDGEWTPIEDFEDENGDHIWNQGEDVIDREIYCSNDERWLSDKGDTDGNGVFGRFDTLTLDYNDNGIYDNAEPLLDCREIGLDYFKDDQYCQSMAGIYEPAGTCLTEFHPRVQLDYRLLC